MSVPIIVATIVAIGIVLGLVLLAALARSPRPGTQKKVATLNVLRVVLSILGLCVCVCVCV